MSHSSGIPVSEQLSRVFGDAITSNKVRFIKAQIVNEEVIDTATHPITEGVSYEEDLDQIAQYIDNTNPAYILFRLDEINVQNNNYMWLLISYVPDKAKVREKMTYSSTRATVKKHLGGTNFANEIFGTMASDFDKKGYKAHVNMQKSENPLTFEERQAMQEREGGVFVGGASTAYVHGVAFPVETAATDALKSLLAGQHNYVQLTIDDKNERITLGESKTIDVSAIGDEVPNDEPRFHFFRYDHDFEGNQVKSVVFVYSCPDGSGNTKSTPVKLRMLYSSSKANVEQILKSVGGKADLKLEVNQGSEVTAESIHNQLHPQKEEEKKAFAKPKGPARNAKRTAK